MEAIHAVNAVLWQPGDQTQKCRQKNRQTDRSTDYTRGRPRVPRVIIMTNLVSCRMTQRSAPSGGSLAKDGLGEEGWWWIESGVARLSLDCDSVWLPREEGIKKSKSSLNASTHTLLHNNLQCQAQIIRNLGIYTCD